MRPAARIEEPRRLRGVFVGALAYTALSLTSCAGHTVSNQGPIPTRWSWVRQLTVTTPDYWSIRVRRDRAGTVFKGAGPPGQRARFPNDAFDWSAVIEFIDRNSSATGNRKRHTQVFLTGEGTPEMRYLRRISDFQPLIEKAIQAADPVPDRLIELYREDYPKPHLGSEQ